MVLLLFWCLEMPAKNAYLIINIADVIFGLIRSNVLGFHLIENFKPMNDKVQMILEIILLVFAIASLIVYTMRKQYKTFFHKVYAVVRTFLSILYSIIVFWAFFDFLINANSDDNTFGRRLIKFIVIVIIQFIDLFWSYILINLIH